MAGDKRKRRYRDQPDKEKQAIAKFLRFKCPNQEAKLYEVEPTPIEAILFTGEDLLNTLMNSKWATAKKEQDRLFTARSTGAGFCETLLACGMFTRVQKKPSKVDDKGRGKGEKARLRNKLEKSKGENSDGTEKEKKDKAAKKVKKKKSRPLRVLSLEPIDQTFEDSPNALYIWIYDPTPFKNYVIGLGLVLGAIGVCLFPLWPAEIRTGVYYLSLAGAAFVGIIMLLVVVRFILFCFVWMLTLGKHHFWLLPNLIEDVSFFESFVPLYKHTVYGKEVSKDDTKKETIKESPIATAEGDAEEGSQTEDGFDVVDEKEVEDSLEKDKDI